MRIFRNTSLLNQCVHIHLTIIIFHCVGFNLGVVQQIIHQLQQDVFVLINLFQKLHTLFFAQIIGFGKNSGKTDNRIQRSTYLMGHIGYKRILQLTALFRNFIHAP